MLVVDNDGESFLLEATQHEEDAVGEDPSCYRRGRGDHRLGRKDGMGRERSRGRP
jgi:hypothetical protein